ncbi:Arginase/deacetylase, partial [Sistotremastrum suecicum HHB10207 ss-3]
MIPRILHVLAGLLLLRSTNGHQAHFNSGDEDWNTKYGPQIDLPFSGPLSFSHLPQTRCLENSSTPFDIGILGMPFDTTTSYRPGARFGPFAIRSGSRRQRPARGYTMAWGTNPYLGGQEILDCGDVPVNPYDNAMSIDQMEVAYSTLISRPLATEGKNPHLATLAKDGKEHPRLITLGGDHTIVLPILRALNKVYGAVSVIHSDAHLDTWSGAAASTPQSQINHGSFFWVANNEGLLTNTSVHAGIRCPMIGVADLEHDASVGFKLISTADIDEIGTEGIIRSIRERVGDGPVYLSLDIDVIDPGLAPATGTPEAGGWTTREVKRTLRGLAGLNIVGADIVEVAPAYDHAEVTGIAAADIVHDFLSLMTL